MDSPTVSPAFDASTKMLMPLEGSCWTFADLLYPMWPSSESKLWYVEAVLEGEEAALWYEATLGSESAGRRRSWFAGAISGLARRSGMSS